MSRHNKHMSNLTRKEQFEALFPNEPKFRWKQIEQALFDPAVSGWSEVTTLSKDIREKLDAELDLHWMSSTEVKTFESKDKNTYKAVLETYDGKRFETVLMANKRGQWTICVSSQIGCAMKCNFCATGTMGLTRSLNTDEIVDQYRFWNVFLKERPDMQQRISNIVFMGMGEPLANYENVKATITSILAHTDIGPTKITVSSIGILAQLDRLITDKEWPHVRIAISLHSANPETRKEIVPTTLPDFLPKLAEWTKKYSEALGNVNHHVTFEYILINEVNDTESHAHTLADYVNKCAENIKVNLMPYNPIAGKDYDASQQKRIDIFKKILTSRGILSTVRRSRGDDIAAACGQLVIQTQQSTNE